MGGREDREAVRARAQRWRQEQRRLRVAVRTAAPPDGALLKRIEELEAENARLATEAQNRVEDLPESAQKKVAIIERRLKREFDARFEPAVQAEAQKRLAEMMVPAVQRQLDDAEMVLRARKGIMSKALFTKLRFALHPDTHASMTPADLNELSQFVNERAIIFMGEKEMPTEAYRMPSIEEFMARRKGAQ